MDRRIGVAVLAVGVVAALGSLVLYRGSLLRGAEGRLADIDRNWRDMQPALDRLEKRRVPAEAQSLLDDELKAWRRMRLDAGEVLKTVTGFEPAGLQIRRIRFSNRLLQGADRSLQSRPELVISGSTAYDYGRQRIEAFAALLDGHPGIGGVFGGMTVQRVDRDQAGGSSRQMLFSIGSSP